MDLLEGLKKANTITNTKGSQYYATSYNSNLDFFSGLSRGNYKDTIIKMFDEALKENEQLALANLLYLLDIREGKGERAIFKLIYKNLCQIYPSLALKILPFIGELGRYDYILVGLDTPVEEATVELIKEQLDRDMKTDEPSLLAKWLPTHRTHNKNNVEAQKLVKLLGMTEKEYRQILKKLRDKLNLIEKNLTNKTYDKIDFSKVPTKAMLKYANAYQKRMGDKYKEYLDQVKEGQAKINTQGLFAYEIVNKVIKCNNKENDELYDLMWNNQKDILKGIDKNILVMADTSGSMTRFGGLPYATSIGLALYTAERNEGIFKDYFMTFSEHPELWKVKGKNIREKINNIKPIVANTNIDEAFRLLLDTAIKYDLKQEDMPEYIIIISDMEFDCGVYSNAGTNFDGWKQSYAKVNYQLPKIIFWNVACNVGGLPVTKFDKDVCMVSGFSTNILDNLLNLEDYSPVNVMLLQLDKYLEMLKNV